MGCAEHHVLKDEGTVVGYFTLVEGGGEVLVGAGLILSVAPAHVPTSGDGEPTTHSTELAGARRVVVDVVAKKATV
jgi:hypothetical protein